MRELIALPVLEDRDQLSCAWDSGDGTAGYGGAFKDEDGLVWGTLRLTRGWVRYPAYLGLMTGNLQSA